MKIPPHIVIVISLVFLGIGCSEDSGTGGTPATGGAPGAGGVAGSPGTGGDPGSGGVVGGGGTGGVAAACSGQCPECEAGSQDCADCTVAFNACGAITDPSARQACFNAISVCQP